MIFYIKNGGTMKKLIIYILCVMFLLSGCTNGAEKTQEQTIVGKQAGESLKIDKNENKDLNLNMRIVSTLNPLLNQDASVDTVLRLIFKPLIAISNNYKPKSSIAESWYFSDEGTTLTLNIKKGLKWYNGDDITADDVVFSVNTIFNAPENSVYKECVSNVLKAEKTEKYTAVIKFKENYVGNVYCLGFPLIPSGYYGGLALNKDINPVGNGSYKVESYTAAKSLKLKAVENSFSETPKIENITVSITNSKDTDLYAFSQSITDCFIADYNSLGKAGLEKNSNKVSFIDNYYDFLGFNFENEILKNKNIRKAVAYAVPIENIIEGVYLSNAVKAASPLNPDSWLNENISSKYSYNLSSAKEYLDSAGYKINGEKRIREKSTENGILNLSFSLIVNKENLQRSQAAVKIAEELNGIGFNINVEKIDYDEYVSRLEKKDFDMVLGGWEMSIVPEFGYMFQSQSKENYIGYSSEKMDNLILEYKKASTDSQMKEKMKLLIDEINEELPYVSLVFRKSALFLDDRIEGEKNPIQFDFLNGIESWYIK